jgi:outer membrane protein TolC
VGLFKARLQVRLAPGFPGPRRTRSIRALLLLVLPVFVLAGLGLEMPGPAAAVTEPAVATDGLLTFEALVHLALRQSPYLTKSSLEIEIRRLDESDSRFEMVPPVTFRSYYFVNRPRDVGDLSSQSYSLSFNMEPYNPVGSYLTLQAQKLATQMAILAHLKVISEGLKNLGKLFLDLGALKRLAAYQTDLVSLAREDLTFAENRQSIGTGTSLEVKVAAQELELARSEQERIRQTEKRLLGQLRGFLGIKTEKNLNLDLRDAQRQVLGNFDAKAATLAQAKDRSYELKMLELKKNLQGYNIALAKAKIFPSLLFTARNPDPLTLNSSHGLYVGFGLEVPVWDGFKRIRNVSRQKVIHKQFGAEKDEKELDLGDRWEVVQGEMQEAAAALKLAHSQEELAHLKERQAEIRYQSGTVQLPAYLEGRKAILEAQKNAAVKAKNYHAAVLKLRLISGDLGQSYVDQSAWQKN